MLPMPRSADQIVDKPDSAARIRFCATCGRPPEEQREAEGGSRALPARRYCAAHKRMVPGFREALTEIWQHADELARTRGVSPHQGVALAAAVRNVACLAAARDRRGRDRWQRDLSIWARRLAGTPVTSISARTLLSPRSVLAACKRVDAAITSATHEGEIESRLFIRDVLILSATSVRWISDATQEDSPPPSSVVESINAFSAARRRDGDSTVDLHGVTRAVARSGLLNLLAPNRLVRVMSGLPDLALSPVAYLREVSRDPSGQWAESASSVLAAYKRACQSKRRGVEWRADPDYVLTVFLSELGEALRPRITMVPNAPIGITRTCELCFRDARPGTFRCARHVYSDRRSAHHQRYVCLSRDLLRYVRRAEIQILQLEEFTRLRQKLGERESPYKVAEARWKAHNSDETLNALLKAGTAFDKWVQQSDLLLSSRSVERIAHEFVRRRVGLKAFRIGHMLKQPDYLRRGGASKLGKKLGISRQQISSLRPAAERAAIKVQSILDEVIGVQSLWMRDDEKAIHEVQQWAVRGALLLLEHAADKSRELQRTV